MIRPEVLEIGAHRSANVRVLHFHRDVAAVVKTRSIDLSDGRRGRGIGVELGKQILDTLAEVLLDHLAHLLERSLRRVIAELASLA